jgi:DNA polymerase III alpha subunit (gram-positive type)
MHYLFFDLETGGLDAKTHSIMTGYFAIYDSEFNLVSDLELFLKPNDGHIVAEESALQVTGLDILTHLQNPKTVTYEIGSKMLKDFLEANKIKGKKRSYRPSGHNIDFDLRFIFEQLMPEEEWKKHIHHNTIDTLRILTFLQDINFLPVELGKLETLVEYFGIQKGKAHDAKEDIKMTVEVYKKMQGLFLGNKLGFAQNTVSSSLLEIIEER